MSRRDRTDPHHHTIPVGPEDGRDPKELSPAENADLCAGCVKCCTYVSVEVDAPRSAWEYDQWIWALHHQGIEILLERPEKWFLHIETRCRKLNDQGRCSIHGRHPVLCREYDPRSCERRLPLADVRAWFRSGVELEEWLRRERPTHHRWLMAFRKDRPPGPPLADARRGAAASAGFVPVQALAAAAAGRRGPRRRA